MSFTRKLSLTQLNKNVIPLMVCSCAYVAFHFLQVHVGPVKSHCTNGTPVFPFAFGLTFFVIVDFCSL